MPPPAESSWSCVWCGRRRRKSGGAADVDDGAGASGRGDQWSLFIDLPVLEAATTGFSDRNLLGRCGFGPVYKGVMEGGQEIAVKRLSLESRQGARERVLKVQHRNLVSLLGCCASSAAGPRLRRGGHKMLVYPYFPNGSLDHFLYVEQGEEGAARLAKTVPDNPWTGKRPPLPPRRIRGEDHPQGHQGEQRSPQRETEPEDFRLRDG